MKHLGVPSMQIVLSGLSRHDADVLLVENPAGTAPDEFDDPIHNQRIPRLGGKALAFLAAAALDRGYRVTRFELLDRYGRMVTDEDFEETASAVLLNELSSRGAAGVLAELSHDYVEYEIGGVELWLGGANTALVRRNGVVFTRAHNPLELFLKANLLEASK